jgi:predicted transcriptional regulator
MSSTKQLYRNCLENRIEGLCVENELWALGRQLTNDPHRLKIRVEGNEDFMESVKELGSGMFEVSKWVGGKTIDLFGKALGAAGAGLYRAFSDNDTLIRKLTQNFSKIEDHELNLSKTTIALITANGDIGHISHDMDTLLSSLDALDKHSKEILSYLDKQLIVVRKLKGASSSENIFAIVEEFEAVKYPSFKLPHSKGTTTYSDALPGGKVWECVYGDGKSPKYVIGGDAPAEAGSTVTLSKSEVNTLLNKLDKINSMHKRLKSSYDSYLSFLKSWSEMVKSVDSNLSKLDKVSSSAMSEAEKILSGEANALAFYSGFTPRVVSYTDRYIHGVLGVFA